MFFDYLITSNTHPKTKKSQPLGLKVQGKQKGKQPRALTPNWKKFALEMGSAGWLTTSLSPTQNRYRFSYADLSGVDAQDIINYCNQKSYPLWQDLCLYHFGINVHPDADAKIIFQACCKLRQQLPTPTTEKNTKAITDAIDAHLANGQPMNAFNLSLAIPFHYYGPSGHMIRLGIFRYIIVELLEDRLPFQTTKKFVKDCLAYYGYQISNYNAVKKENLHRWLCELYLLHAYNVKKYYNDPLFFTQMETLGFYETIERNGGLEQLIHITEESCQNILTTNHFHQAQQNANNMLSPTSLQVAMTNT